MEAVLIHFADNTSAQLYYFHEAAEQAGAQEQFSYQGKLDSGFGGSGRRVFVGDIPGLRSDPVPAPEASIHSHDGQQRIRQERSDYNPLPHAVRLPVLRLIHIDRVGPAVKGVRVLPLIGRVAAGARVLDPENVEEHLHVEGPLSATSHYLVRVQGDSMSGDDIWHEDLLIVRHQETAEPNDIVVAQVPGGGPVVKRLERRADGVCLLSSNPAFPPVRVPDASRLQVQGVVVGIARNLNS